MGKRVKQSTSRNSVGRGFSSINDRGRWKEGVVVTTNGVVWVYTQGDANNFHHTSLRFSCDGIYFVREISRRLSDRAMVTAAKGFAWECIHGTAHLPQCNG